MFSVGDKVYFVHLNYISTDAVIKTVNNNNCFIVEFKNIKNKKVSAIAYKHELFKSRTEYLKIFAKERIPKLLSELNQIENREIEIKKELLELKQHIEK